MRTRIALAGRAAEEIVFGKAEVTTAAVDDIQLATYIARQMVTEFGMSPLGPVAFRQSQPQDAFMRNGRQSYSNQLAFLIDTNIRILVYYAFMEALTIVRQNRDLITKLANKILPELTTEDAVKDHDASTNGLINCFKEFRKSAQA